MLGLSPWTSLFALFAAAVLARLVAQRDLVSVRQILGARGAPAVVGVLSGVLSMWLWGSLRASPVLHDEAAYLLQAELFARLHWIGGGRPLPHFFEQFHVLVNGVTASKYPPGNSLILALGALVALPGLPVVSMNAFAAGLLFALARRVAGPITALLSWMIWQSSFPVMYYHANYMSEGASSLLWLVTWWALWNWRSGGARKWLVIAAFGVAWCLITRPLTGLALAIPALAILVRECYASRSWRDLVPAVGVGAVVISLIPIWSWATTGSPTLTPLGLYTRTHLPFDKPGFGVHPEDHPVADLPPDQRVTSAAFYQEHARHTLSALPRIAVERLTMIDRDMWYEWRGGLRVFALLGLLALPVEGWIALAAFLLQFLLYLSYAHPPWWTIYYVEGTPVLAFVTALGVSRFFTFPFGSWKELRGRRITGLMIDLRRPLATRESDGAESTTAGLLVALALFIAGIAVARQVRAKIREDHAYFDAFAQLLKQIPDDRSIVFVRYMPTHPDGLSLVRNVADPDRARVWVVYDRGAEDQELMAITPDRAAYLFEESTWTLRPIRRPAAPKDWPIEVVVRDSVRGRRAVQRPR